MKTLKIKDICEKGSSSLKQKDIEGKDGKYPVFGASGYISSIDTYHQDKEYIAIVKDGSGIGRVNFMPAYSSVIGTMQYILPKEGYNIKYISYCLQSLDLTKYKQGAAIPHIYFRDYGERFVNVEDSLIEQERIVSFLDAQFAKIDAIKANAEKQLQEAKTLFQNALKDLLTPKEGWKRKIMSDICTLSQGLAINSKTRSLIVEKSSIPLLRIKDMKNGTKEIFIDDIRYPKSCLAIPEDIIYTRTGTLGLVFTGQYGIVHNNCFKINLNTSEVNKSFYMYYIQEGHFRNNIIKEAEKSVQADITHSLFKKQIISYPNKIEQNIITEKLDDLLHKVTQLQSNYSQTITLCEDLKKSLLKDIFS